jgi:hypothetical protein
MSEGEIKVFNITGEAAKAYTGGTKKKRVTRKRGGEEDINNTNNTNIPHQVINLPNIAAIPSNSSIPNTVQVSIPLSNIVKQISTNTTISRENAPPEPPRPVIQDGGNDKKIKVELKKKQATKKVQLHPKKDGPQKVATAKKSETRKKNRKVLLGVASLHKRMTRAKKMHKKVKEMPLDKLREELINKKLIKSTSKAPESILRQIATDAQIVDSKSL